MGEVLCQGGEKPRRCHPFRGEGEGEGENGLVREGPGLGAAFGK